MHSGSRAECSARHISRRGGLSQKESEIEDAPLDFKDYGPQLHRNFRALKVWMTFKAYGARQLRASIASNIEIMRYLADRIDESKDFVRLAPVPLSVVCFQYRTDVVSRHSDQSYLDALNSRLLDAVRKGRTCVSIRHYHQWEEGASCL